MARPLQRQTSSGKRGLGRHALGWLVLGSIVGILAAAMAARGTGSAAEPLQRWPAHASSAASLPTQHAPEQPGPDAAPEPDPPDTEASTIEEQRERVLTSLSRRHELEPEVIARLREIFSASRWLGQGNPRTTVHPMSRSECRERRRGLRVTDEAHPACGAPDMVPLYARAAGESPDRARVCIDRYEFPNLACEYPFVWVRADEVVTICRALGKRICDAHEWEGACAGSLRSGEDEYPFGKPRLQMRYWYNLDREVVWAYGKEKNHALCAMGSKKSPNCAASGYQCGSNTYPAGAFPECASPFGVYDLHGNAAEHMNLPVKPEQLASRGGLGYTEMKGSWFVFQSYEAHIDDCRWRAPAWHETRINDPESHRNYHLGFRCCKDVPAPEPG